MTCNNMQLATFVDREEGGVGDASIRKIAYFDGAKDPSLFKGNVRAYSLSLSHTHTHTH